MIRIPQVWVDPMIPAGPIVRRGTIGRPADLPALPIEAGKSRRQVAVAVIRVPVIVPAVHLAGRKETSGRPTVEAIGRIGMAREPIVGAAT